MARLNRMSLVFAGIFCAVGVALALPPMPELLDRDATLKQVRELTRDVAPDARTLTYAQSRYVVYAPDGSSTLWIEWWVKAFTEEGAKELHNIPLYYKKGFSEGEFQMAEIIRADGSVLPIKVRDHVQDVSSNDGNDENIYDQNSRNLVLTVTQLEKDDTLHFVMARQTMRPRIPDTFTDFDTFESTECPLPYASLTIVAPKELPLKSMAVLDEVPGTVTTSRETLKDGRTLHRWIARNVPQTFKEENMPDESTQLQRVIVSTFSSWEELSKWYWGLCEPHFAMTPAIVEKVKELTQGKSKEEQIAALFGFVAQEIRYMGIIAEDTAPGYEPHDVALTFDNRYGVCRDKGALLVAMLREAGFNSFPVLINAGSQRDKEVPLPFFNHAIVAVDMGNFDYYLIDPTDDTARAEMPAYLSDCTYLVARPEGDTLRVTPVPSPEANRMEIVTDGTLETSGDLTLTATLQFNGVNDNAYRSLFIKSTPEILRARLDGMMKRVVPGAELVSFTYSPENPQDITQPLVLNLNVSVKGYAVPNAEGRTIVKLPYFSRVFGLVNFLFDGLDQPTRKYDWVISAPCGVREKVTLRGFNALGEAHLLPTDPILKSNGASYDVICKRDVAADTITLTRELELSHKTYTPENYRALRRFVERMSRFEDLRPLFVKPANTEEDASILQNVVESTLNLDGTATRRYARKVRVNTFQGKRSQGEMKLWLAPAWQNLTLQAAEVTTATGDCIAVTPKEINELDSDGAALSPRYPNWKQTVISLPAVEVGSVSYVDWIIASKDQRPFCETITFGDSYSTAEETYRLAVPLAEVSEMRIAERHFDGVQVERKVEQTETHQVYTWTVRDLPAIKSEPATPGAELIAPTIHVAHRKAAAHRTMPELFAKVAALVKQKQPQTKAMAKQILADVDEDDVNACLTAIQNFMSRRVRTLGPAWDALPFGTISSPDETLAAGYGNRLDRLVLWMALLKEADITTELVFADDHTLAFACAFNDVLAAREVPRWTRWSTPYLRLQDGRLIGDAGECDPVTATRLEDCGLMTARGRELYHAEAADQSYSRQTIRVVVDVSGDAVLSSEVLRYGLDAGALRRAVREFTPETRRRAIAATADALATGAEPCSEYVIDTEAYPVRTRLAVAAKSYGVRQGNLLNIPVPTLVSPFYKLRGTRRDNPIWQGEVNDYTTEVDIWLPKGCEVLSRPEPFVVTLPGGGTYELALKDERRPYTGQQRLTYTVRLNATPAILDNWLFSACLELDRRLMAPEMSTIVVRLPE
ncbi:MAG: DUF3857 domain-containing protein [Kiritimatiellae bacterium]|nr:DUF3857 domain-containing protein [Kiritimatiellia bacterium]